MPRGSAFTVDTEQLAQPQLELEQEFELPGLESEGAAELEYLLSPTRLFSCAAPDQARIRAVVGPATPAQLRSAIGAAVAQATREAWGTARALRSRPRSPRATRIFRSVFNVPPTFVPPWRPAGSSWLDLGDLVALRLERAAGDLNSGYTRFFCWGCRPTSRACSTPRATVRADRHRIFIGRVWWRWWRASLHGPMLARPKLRGWMASTLLHEALHIYFVLSHRTVTVGRPSVNNVYCYDTLVALFHRRSPKDRDRSRCRTGWRPRAAHPHP